nr:P-loop NTPase fold protein [Dyella sp. ASV21]
MADTSAAKIQFIEDDASTDDEIGAHSRLSHAIASAIEDNPKLKVVGLLGAWGSGKSTVVNLIRKTLREKDPKRFLVMSYDAWLHQSDPPKRAFLEALVHYLEENNLTSYADWKVRLDQLNGRIVDSTVTNTPVFSRMGWLLLISLLLVGPGLSLVLHSWEKAFSGHPWQLVALGVGAFLIVLPLLLALGTYLAWRPTWNPFNPAFFRWVNWTQHKSRYEGQSILAILLNRQIATSKSRIIKDLEPSTIEFQQVFGDVLCKTIPRNTRLILVVDNFDRLPDDEAFAMWATIRSFFSGPPERNRQSAFVPPTVLLPVDKQAIHRLFPAGDDAANPLAAAFMEKTFDIVFHLPRPVLTTWKAYLKKRMVQAFGDSIDPDWIYATGRFLDNWFRPRSTAVTPRKLNSIVNLIATYWLQWRSESITFASVAYYCVFRSEIEENILSATTTPLATIEIFDHDWQRAIAAIHYGVSPSEAYEVLLDTPLRKAIEEREAEKFLEMSESLGFNEVVTRIAQDFRKNEMMAVESSLKLVGLLAKMPQPSSVNKEVWKLLKLAITTSNRWNNVGDAVEAQELCELFEHCSEHEWVRMLSEIERILRSIDQTRASDRQFIQFFTSFWSRVDERFSASIEQISEIYVPGNLPAFTNVAVFLERNPRVLSRLTTVQGLSGFDNSLFQEAQNGSLGHEITERRFKAITATKLGIDWTNYCVQVVQLVISSTPNHQGIAAGLGNLGFLRGRGSEGAKEALRQTATAGRLSQRLQDAVNQFKEPFGVVLAARCLALLMLTAPKTLQQLPPEWWTARRGRAEDFSEAVDVALESFALPEERSYANLLKIAQASAVSSLAMQAVLGRRVEDRRLPSFEVADVLERLDLYLDNLPHAKRGLFLRQISEVNGFLELLKSQAPSDALFQMLEDLHQEDDLRERTKDAALRLMSRVDRASWQSSITEGGPLVSIVQSLPLDDVISAGSSTLREALGSETTELLEGKDSQMRKRWFAVLDRLSQEQKASTLMDLRDRILSSPSAPNLLDILEKWGGQVLSLGVFRAKADECARAIVLPMLASKHGRAILLVLKVELIAIVSDCLPPTFETVRLKLIDLISEADVDAGECARELMRVWKIKEVR